MIINGGIANFNGDGTIYPVVLQQTFGTLGGSNVVTINGPFVWSGGTVTGTNSVIVNGGLTLAGISTKDLTGRTLVNAGTAVWSAGAFRLGGGAVFSNAATGTFDIAFDGTIQALSGGGTIANAGLLRQIAGTNGTSIAIPFQNSGNVEILAGLLDIGGAAIYSQSAGLTLLNGGGLESTAAIRILGGTLAGNGLVNAPLTNSGTISPGTSPGQLIITGPYTQTTNGTFAVELAGAPATGNYDRLVISNGFNLAGTLTVTLTNDFYPAPDVIFTNLIRGGSRTNAFNTFNFPSNVLGLQLNYSATNVNLEVINTLPNFPVIAPQTNNELVLLSFNVNATDADTPAQLLSYALINSPTNASINASGQINWTPTEVEGPFTTNITVVVTDNGTPNLSTNQTFSIVVNEINVAPILTVPSPQVITEQNALTGVAASATDADVPVNPLTYSLVAPPGGMTINSTSGAISWTPSELQGSNSYTIIVVATDTNALAVNTQSFSVTNTFAVTVNESNRAPVLTVPASQTINEAALYSTNATAMDPDLPANALAFALASGPTGMVVNASGVINWTPSEFQGPGIYPVQIKVTDTNPLAINATSLSVTSSFTLTVGEVNLAPTVGGLANQSGNPGQTVSFTATTSDADLPTNTLSFNLINPPAGASIVVGSGLFSWRLPAVLANTTNILAVRVTDNGSPNLSGTNTFTVTVNPILPVVLTPLNYANGQFRIGVTGSLGPDYVLQGSTTLTSFANLTTNTPGAMPFIFTNASTLSNRSYRVRLQP